MKKPKSPKGEMPFLDHLEELRWRILWSLAALVVGTIIGFLVVQNFDVLEILKRPIAPYLPDGRLVVTRPTDAFFVTLKLALLVGFILAAPVIFTQVWGFLSPALYEHEKRYITPALIAGAGLFVIGSALAYLWVLPVALRFLLTNFQWEDLEFFITATAYFGFAIQLIVAFGLMFEVPLFMILLSSLGLVSPATFAKQRPIALVVASILAAILTPPDVASMMMLMLPVVVLYEVGIVVCRLVWKRRVQHPVAGILLLLGLGFAPAEAQEPVRRPPVQREVPDSLRQRVDSLAQRPDSARQPLDTAVARSLGLPSQPSRSFPPADSVITALLEREGYGATRYASDSLTLLADTKEIRLHGRALVEREGSLLEADSVNFLQDDCLLLAGGRPTLFDRETVLMGGGMRYDTCERRGIVAEALTRFNELGATWYLRGELAVDSASTRMYGAKNNVTTCDHPDPHYHFAAGNVKWVSNTLLVARPAVLYIRDVPVMWLPFIFQDMRKGRHSGLLVPRFGINDLVRPNSGYRRHVSNLGYYFAINDYVDFLASVDWFSGNYTALNGQVRYRWLDRFVQGTLGVSRIFESGVDGAPGARSLRLQWAHQQSFNQQTRLSANVDYATSARVIEQNAVDPYVQTATLGSRINFSKRYDWGTLSLGGSRSQDLSSGTTTQTLPSLSLSPAPINFGESVTWSPSFSLTRRETLDQRPGIPLLDVAGVESADSLFPDQRDLQLQLATPIRIGRWNWQNDFQISDFRSTRPPPALTVVSPDDSTDITTRYYAEDFNSSINWNTGINLPILFAATWKLQPTVGIQNTTTGAYMIRNRFTGGSFVRQGKRLSFGASLSPTVFGFFPGVGPVTRIRHSLSPRVSWNLRPAADVPEEYARALAGPGREPELRSATVHTIQLGLSQTFEGKLRPEPGDTAADPRNARKVKILSIQTSSIAYDFEQAKDSGKTGWITPTLNNSFTSDLLRGFTLSISHDLWRGQVGSDTAKFDPFLTSVSARFSLSGTTVRNILALFTGGETSREEEEEDPSLEDPREGLLPGGISTGRPRGLDPTIDQLGARSAAGRGFRASFTYDERRRRPRPSDDTTIVTPADRTLGMQFGFSPTESWSVSWNTQYNITTKEFGQHVLRLDREMHRWRATFAFIKAPNGNFAFNFFVSLRDQPDVKFQYDQRTVRSGG